MLVSLALGILGVIALGAAVLGILWLVQFVVGNEEGRARESR
jgi:hypothetical protein